MKKYLYFALGSIVTITNLASLSASDSEHDLLSLLEKIFYILIGIYLAIFAICIHYKKDAGNFVFLVFGLTLIFYPLLKFYLSIDDFRFISNVYEFIYLGAGVCFIPIFIYFRKIKIK